MGKADLHIHSSLSDGMASVPDIMAYVQERTDLDVVALADHDQIDGSLEALEWVRKHPGCRFALVFGTEVTATLGRHLLAYFFRPPYPDRPLPMLKSYRHTIALIHEMGGVAAVPHPTMMWTPSGGYRHIRWLLQNDTRIDAIEVCNAAPGARDNEKKLRKFNHHDFHLAEIGGSDAHHLSQIGAGYTSFRGHTIADLELALLHHECHAHLGEPGRVTLKEHAQQVFKSWVEKPTRSLRAILADQ